MWAVDRVTTESGSVSFQSLFVQSKGQPIAYKGHTLHMVDRLRLVDGQILKVIFESAHSDWRQGIAFDADGGFDVAGKVIKRKLVLWRDTAPDEVLLAIHTRTGEFLVKNVWDVGNGVIESWHNGAAMILEDLPNGRRYRCNDGFADEDFDDLVFRLEWS